MAVTAYQNVVTETSNYLGQGTKVYHRPGITMLDVEQFPFTSMVRKGGFSQSMNPLVGTDAYPAISTLAGIYEGVNITLGTATNFAAKRGYLANIMHLWREDFGVTNVQQSISLAGGVANVNNEFARAERMAVTQAKRQLEAVLLGGQDMTIGATNAAWTMRGLYNWITTSAAAAPTAWGGSYDAAPFAPASGQFTPTNSIVTGLTTDLVTGFSSISLTDLMKVLQSVWGVTGAARTLYMFASADILSAIDAILINGGNYNPNKIQYNVQDGAANRTIDVTVKTFTTTFGTVHFVPSAFVNLNTSTGAATANSAVICDMDLLETQWLQEMDMVSDEAPRNSGGRQGWVQWGCGLLPAGIKAFGRLSA